MGDQAAQEVAHRRAHGAAHATGGGNVVAGSGDQGREAGLAAGLAAGNHEALAELYDRYATVAYGVAMRVLGDPGRAEDAVQDAFMNVWNHAASFDAERGSLRAWLLTSVRNRCIDYLRGRGAHERDERELRRDAAYSVSTAAPWRAGALSL